MKNYQVNYGTHKLTQQLSDRDSARLGDRAKPVRDARATTKAAPAPKNKAATATENKADTAPAKKE